MTIYYKATNARGESFGDPAIAWRSGRIVRDPAREAVTPRLCHPGLLHAATTPTEALTTYGVLTHPHRLFAVEPRGSILAADQNKVGCRAWKVDAELEPWRAYGPQGREVMALIDRAARLTADEAQRLRAARAAAGAAARDAAWDAARDAARDAAWAAARDAARAAAWDAAWDAARAAAWDAAWAAAGDAARNAAWDAAGDAARAARARVVRDLISDAHYRLLAGPWLEVIGE